MNTQAELSELMVEGMSCSNCAMGVRKRLEKQGLAQVDVNFATGEVRFENIPNKPLNEIAESIEDLGYTVTLKDTPKEEKKNS
jgi:P-type Cu+ transporter